MDRPWWLSYITDVDRVPDNVLKRHVNMQHPLDIYGSFISMYSILVRLRDDNVTQYNLVLNSKHMQKYKFWVDQFRWKLLNDRLNYIHPKQVELNMRRSQVS